MSFSSPSSFACRCAPMKYCGLRNEMQLARHDMALWVLLRCAQLLLNSICHAVKSYFAVLFLNLPRHHGFFLQSCYLLHPFAIDCHFNLLTGILYLTWSARCCFNTDHCYFCEGLPLLVVFPGDWKHQEFCQGSLARQEFYAAAAQVYL